MNESLERLFRKHGFCPVYNVYHKLRANLPSIKDKIPPDKRTGMVYKIPYRDCNSCYIDQTGRTLKTRVREHRKNVNENVIKHTALTKHLTEYDHPFNYNETSVEIVKTLKREE